MAKASGKAKAKGNSALTDLQALVKQHRDAAAFNRAKEEEDPEDAGYRNGYAAAMDAAAKGIDSIIAKLGAL